MKSLLEQVKGIDQVIRQLQIISSRMEAGQFIDAHRRCHNLMGSLMQHKADLIDSNVKEGDDD
jgi:hypothetical protein